MEKKQYKDLLKSIENIQNVSEESVDRDTHPRPTGTKSNKDPHGWKFDKPFPPYILPNKPKKESSDDKNSQSKRPMEYRGYDESYIREGLLGAIGGAVKKTANTALDAAQIAGDIVGIVDPTGIVDVANAGVSGVRAAGSAITGNKEGVKDHLINAGLRGVSAIPYAGDAVGKTALAARFGIKAARALKGTKAVTTGTKVASKVTPKAIETETKILRKQWSKADPETKKLIGDKIRGLQHKAKEEAQRQSKERLFRKNKNDQNIKDDQYNIDDSENIDDHENI
jgi:hypothetical protein